MATHKMYKWSFVLAPTEKLHAEILRNTSYEYADDALVGCPRIPHTGLANRLPLVLQAVLHHAKANGISSSEALHGSHLW